MLQASEYSISDYFAWYHRTRDFLSVERRKSLVQTPKARASYIIAWITLIFIYALAIYILWFSPGLIKFLLFFCLILATPYILAYALPIPIFILNLAQKIFESFILRRMQKKLGEHPGIKIAIAGSYGKTSMKEILKTVLSGNGTDDRKVAAPPHSHNTIIGTDRFLDTLVGDEKILIFELGEYYQGDVYKLCRLIDPGIGIITGVNEAHIVRFKTLDRTVKTIFELADWIGSRPLYVNGENDLTRNSARQGDSIYSREGVGSLKVSGACTDLSGVKFVVSIDGRQIGFESKLLGLHHIGPLVAAVDMALSLGLSVDEIKQGVSKTKPFDHRLEPKTDSQGVTILDDSYNGNPDGVKAVIDFLSSIKGRRRWYVTPGLVEMGLQTEAVHKRIGTLLAQAGIEKIILIRNSVTSFISQGLIDAGYKGEVIWFDDALTAFKALSHLTVKDDIVLLQNDWPDQYA
jgi:UDP-N-acetylmuramoyl-tripeptide--D-alanyl-D-alanine ligase